MAIGLRVANFSEAFDFYTNSLELEVKIHDEKNKFAELQLGDLKIALLTDDTLESMCGKSQLAKSGLSNIVIAVEVDDISEKYNQLKDKVKFIEKPKTTPWGQKVAYFKDIEGYVWEISEPFGEE